MFSQLLSSIHTTQYRSVQVGQLPRVIYGKNVIEHLKDLIQLKQERWLLLTTKSILNTGLMKVVIDVIGEEKIVGCRLVKPHVPVRDVEELIETYIDIDGIITLGGGSCTDTAKAFNFMRLHGLREADIEPHKSVECLTQGIRNKSSQGVDIISFPTTLSGAEFTPTVGISDRNGVKCVFRGSDCKVSVVILDPRTAQYTPDKLWSSTGFRAIDHVVETAFAMDSHPLVWGSVTLALESLLKALIPSTKDRDDLNSVLTCQVGSWLSIWALGSVHTGLSHAIGHQIGAKWGVPHGITSCLTLLPTIQWGIKRGVHYEYLEDSLRINSGSLTETLSSLLNEFHLPRTLKELGLQVGESDFVEIIPNILSDANVPYHPVKVTNEDVLQILNSMIG